MSKTRLYPILLDPDALACYARALGIAHTDEALWALAEAISTSPYWQFVPQVRLVVRPQPLPALGILGSFDAVGEARLQAVARGLDDACRRLRYVTYAQAEQDCQRLASLIAQRIPASDMERFHFVALPRGGLVVLGLLAYCLDLNSEQLTPPVSADVPLVVVVDDCAYSGARFSRFLQQCPSQRVIFAHLYSHPHLRAAIEAAEPRVEACISAQDLQICQREGRASAARTPPLGWIEELQATRYWVGHTEHVCFPWNEPDRVVFNTATGQWEKGFPLVPPALCLKNRPRPGMTPLQVNQQPAGTGALRPSEHLLFGESDGQVIVGNVATGESFGLADVAADMWRAIVRCGNLDDAAAALLKEYDVDEARLRADLQTFAADLLARGLLVRTDATG